MCACLHASESGERGRSGPKNFSVAFLKNHAVAGDDLVVADIEDDADFVLVAENDDPSR